MSLLNSQCRWPARALIALLALTVGCAPGIATRKVEFTAPAPPDPALRPFLDGVSRLGVMCVTTIKPFRELDTEKVIARLSSGLSHSLANIPGITVVSQDEITWQLKEVRLDSAEVVTAATRAALLEVLKLDALVLVELSHVEARTTPMTPTPYGLAASPGLDLAVDLKVSLLNLHTNKAWQQAGQHRDWKPVQVQLFGEDQGERQLLLALSRPLETFLVKVAPPPRRQERWFEISGD